MKNGMGEAKPTRKVLSLLLLAVCWSINLLAQLSILTKRKSAIKTK
jgi:hypothetical protein